MDKEEYLKFIKDKLNSNSIECEWWNRDAIIGRYFLGVWTEKNSFDAWRYQEIIFDKKPDIILETGSFVGGSAFYIANIMDLINHGRIISIDNRDNGQFNIKHPRIEFRLGNCLNQEYSFKNEKIMVILDCDHSIEHVKYELDKYSKYTTSGQYLIIEDTIVHGAIRSVDEFLNKNNDFSRESEPLFTSNYGGYLKRK